MAANFRQVKNRDYLNLTLKISKMKKSRFSESQILAIIKEKESGLSVAEVCRKHGISDATLHNWKKKFLDVVDETTFASYFEKVEHNYQKVIVS
jgi:DNA polymerase III epsilon subunit-like protein